MCVDWETDRHMRTRERTGNRENVNECDWEGVETRETEKLAAGTERRDGNIRRQRYDYIDILI